MKQAWFLAALVAAVAAAPTPSVAGEAGPWPWTFTENRGQWDDATKFVAGRAGLMRVERDALVLALPGGGTGKTTAERAVRLVFEGASPTATVVGEDRSRGVTHFLVGNDPSRWRRDVPSYRHVLYRELWDGVDVRVRGDAGRVKYDVLVAPGADLESVVMRCEGVTALALAEDGSLVMEMPAGSLRQPPPVSWQDLPFGGRMTVECGYRLLGGDRYGFTVAGRDPGLPLVIDPTFDGSDLEWSTFFGSAESDIAVGVAVTPEGEVIAVGFTDGVIPTTGGSYDPSHNGGPDAWVACFEPHESGTDQLMWCTYLGGAGYDAAFDVALDPADGSVLVAGKTMSSDFPRTLNAYDESVETVDAFVARLSAHGDSLLYATYLGGFSNDWATNVAPGATGITVMGRTDSDDFPTTPWSYDLSYNGGWDVFVTRILVSADSSSLVFSTFLGGSHNELFYSETDQFLGGLEVEASGAVTLAGLTLSPDFPVTAGAYQDTLNWLQDGYVARLSAIGDSLLYATYFGGSSGEGITDLVILPAGKIAVSGYTVSDDLPTTDGAFDRVFHGAAGLNDGFIAVFDSTLSVLEYGTFVGGSNVEGLSEITFDPSGSLVATGHTRSADFPTKHAYDSTYAGDGTFDAVVIRLCPVGHGEDDLRYSTYMGGTGRQHASALALLPPPACGPSSVAVVGGTWGSDYPTTANAFDTSYNGGLRDAMLFCLFASDGVTGIDEPMLAGSASEPRLGAPRPNPTEGAVAFTVDLPADARVRVGIYDVHGRLVTELLDRDVAAGRHELSWEPEALGQRVAAGVYFIRLEAGGREESRKVTLRP